MAKATFIPGNNEIEVVDFEGDNDIDRQKTDFEEKIESFKDAMKSDPKAFITVYRQITPNSPEEYVERFAPDKYDPGQLLDYLSTTYGGGDYRVRLYIKGKIHVNTLLQIAHKAKPSNLPQANPTGDAAQILNVVLQEMRNSQEKMFLAMQQKTESRSDLLKDLALFREVLGGNPAPVNPFEAMKPMLEFMTMMGFQPPGAAEPHEKGFMDVLEKSLPVLLRGMQQQPAPRMARAQIPAPEQTPVYKPNPVEPLHSSPEVDPQEQELRQMLTILVKAARKNGDHYTYATMMFDQFDPAIIAQIAQTVGVVDMLGSIDPAVTEFRPWFLLLVEHLKAQLGLESEVASEYDDLTDGDSEDNNTGENSPETPDNVNP